MYKNSKVLWGSTHDSLVTFRIITKEITKNPYKRFSSFICRRWQKNFSHVVDPLLEKLWRPGQSAGPLGTVSGTGFLAADALDHVDCRLGPPWMWLQGISWMLNYVEIWQFWKLDQIFELFIALNSFFPGQFLGRGWRIVLLWQWHYDGDVEVENWHPHEFQGTEFPCRTIHWVWSMLLTSAVSDFNVADRSAARFS